MAMFRGVDGCPAGWLAVSLDPDSGALDFRVAARASDLFDEPAAITAIDIPIGLPPRGVRLCDRAARALLGPRKSSVFPAPIRLTLAAGSYADACEAARRAGDKGINRQTYALIPRIAEIDAALTRSPALMDTVREVHPEVCFYFWNGRVPLHEPKKSGFGFMHRFGLVETRYPGMAQRMRAALRRREAGDDDILDALAALWSAERIAAGRAVRIPQAEQRDELGLPMHIWA